MSEPSAGPTAGPQQPIDLRFPMPWEFLPTDEVDIALLEGPLNHTIRFPHPHCPVPLTTGMEIAQDVWLSPIDDDKAQQIYKACWPPGEGIALKRRRFACAFVRRKPPLLLNGEVRFDADGRLDRAIALSRIEHPTGMGYEVAGRVRVWMHKPLEIYPANVGGLPRSAYPMEEGHDWFNDWDLAPIRDLVVAFGKRPLPQRVLRAMWQLEFAYRSRWPALKWPHLMTGLEALIHIPKEKRNPPAKGKNPRITATEAFAGRLEQVAKVIGLKRISYKRLERIYEHRSEIVHGASGPSRSKQGRADLVLAERLLRLIVREAILSRKFAKRFANAKTVSHEWPL